MGSIEYVNFFKALVSLFSLSQKDLSRVAIISSSHLQTSVAKFSKNNICFFLFSSTFHSIKSSTKLSKSTIFKLLLSNISFKFSLVIDLFQFNSFERESLNFVSFNSRTLLKV
jgi:hypothetical protein